MIAEILTADAIAERRRERLSRRPERVTFQVSNLYGLSRHGVSMPLGGGDAIDSGQVCITLDPRAEAGTNHGVANFSAKSLVVRYGIQAVFPGLFRLVTRGRHDPSLLQPVRAVATDECTIAPDLSGWSALGCLEFLPGSVWSGTEGG